MFLTEFFDPTLVGISFKELAEKCQLLATTVTVSRKQMGLVEKKTRGQSESSLVCILQWENNCIKIKGLCHYKNC